MRYDWKYVLILFGIYGCYQAPKVEGFDRELWGEQCNDSRLIQASQILKPLESQILEANQNEIEVLLGKPNRHQLYNRNQKIFYYPLDCRDSTELMIRFDALGRAKEIHIQLK